jgi:hypothetical protein
MKAAALLLLLALVAPPKTPEPPTPEAVREAARESIEACVDAGRFGLSRENSVEAARANRLILQAIVDGLNGYDGPRVILLPPGTHFVDRMLELSTDRLKLKGRESSALRMHASRSDGLLYLGRLRRTAGPGEVGSLRPDEVIDLEPRGLPGRSGLKTSLHAAVVDADGPLAFADLSSGFTAELLLDTTDHALPAYGPIVGAYGWPPRPWSLQISDGWLYCQIGASDGTAEGYTVHGFFAPKPAKRGLVWITLQFDAATGRALVMEDGRLTFSGPVGGYVPGRKLLANERTPFQFGAQHRSPLATGSLDVRSDEPRTRVFCGFHLLKGPRYRDDGERRDGAPKTPEGAVFEVQKDTAGLLPLRDDFATVDSSRRVEIQQGNGLGHAAYMVDEHASNPWNVLGDFRIEGVGLRGSWGDPAHGGIGYPAFGSTIVLPNVLNPKIADAQITGNRRGIASWGESATYLVRVERCDIGGLDVALSLNYAIAQLRDLRLTRMGRSGVELIESRTTLDGMFLEPNESRPRYVLRVLRGGQLVARNVVSDWEGREAPSVAGFRFDGGGTYRIEQGMFGWLPPTVPMVWASTVPGSPVDLSLVQLDWAHYADAGVLRQSGPVMVEMDRGTAWRAVNRARPTPPSPEPIPVP